MRCASGALIIVFLLAVASFGIGCTNDSGSKKQTSKHPANPVAAKYLIKAQQLSRAGDHYSALALTDSAMRYDPDLAEAHFMKGRVFSDLRRFDRAEKSYRRVLALDPEFQGVWFNLGNNAFRREEFRKALKYYQKEQEDYPSAALSFHRGRAYAELGKADSARQALKQSLAADSSYAAAYHRLGEIYEEEGALDSALSYAQRALKQSPENGNYRYRVGSLLLRTGKEEKALEHLRAVADERAWHYGAHYNIGQALMRLDREEEAESYLSRADSLESIQSDIEELQSLANMNPNQTMHWVKLGNALHKVGRVDDAIQVYETALAQAPHDLSLRNNLAVLKAKQGNLQSAIAQYRAILRQDSTHADAWFNLGIAYARSNNKTGAIKAWRKVLKYEPSHQQAENYLAKIESAN